MDKGIESLKLEREKKIGDTMCGEILFHSDI